MCGGMEGRQMEVEVEGYSRDDNQGRCKTNKQPGVRDAVKTRLES